MNQREKDFIAEKELGKYLDRYFYSKFTNGWIVENMYSKDNQLRGCDVFMESKDESKSRIIIDEKSQLHYLEKPLETFAFEIAWKEKDDYRDGWFINNRLKTDAYLIIWPHANGKFPKQELDKIKVENFKDVEAAYIDKEDIISYINNCGFNVFLLSRYAYLLYQIEQTGEIHNEGKFMASFKTNDGKNYWYFKTKEGDKLPFWLCYSPSYNEKPVNLIISKEKLINLSKWYGVINPDKITSKKGSSKDIIHNIKSKNMMLDQKH